MNTFTGAFGGYGRPAGFSQGKGGIVANLYNAVRTMRARSALGSQLSQLSDRQLSDIGLSRADVPGSFWGDFGALGRDGNR